MSMKMIAGVPEKNEYLNIAPDIYCGLKPLVLKAHTCYIKGDMDNQKSLTQTKAHSLPSKTIKLADEECLK